MSNEFLDSLPEELQAHVGLSKFESPAALAKSYIELENFKGNAIRTPGPDASEADIKAFGEKLREKMPNLMSKPDFTDEQSMALYRETVGVPQAADGYTAEVEGLDDASANRLKELAHQAGLTPDQYKVLAKGVMGHATEEREVINGQVAEMESKLQAKWGDSMAQRKERVESFLTANQDADLPVEGLSPAQYLFMDKVIEMLKGKGAIGPEVATGEVAADIGELIERNNEIRNKLMDDQRNMTMDERRALLKKLDDNQAIISKYS